MKKVFYWQGVLGSNHLLAKYSSIIDKLLEGNYKSANLDLKKLAGYRVYSVRVNHDDRLLFTTIEMADKQYLLLLEEILGHDYQKSSFLKPSVLKNYLEKNQAILSQQINDTHFHLLPDDENLSFLKQSFPSSSSASLSSSATSQMPAPTTQYSALEFFNEKFIELNNTQNQARYAPKPLILRGAAGSGKSCVALSILIQTIEQSEPSETIEALYITQSALLAAHMEKLWQQLPIAHVGENKHVVFASYNQMLEQITHSDHHHFLDKKDTYAWLSNHIKKMACLQQKDILFNQESIPKIYQEFRILAGYSKEEYFNLGKRQSLFAQANEKKWLWDTFTEYSKSLKEYGKFHPAFSSFTSTQKYHTVVVDEGQDFSTLQLKVIYQMAQTIRGKAQVCFCLDHNQSLLDNLSKHAFLVKLCSTGEQTAADITLTETYRCPPAVIRLTNALLKIRHALVGGLMEKDEPAQLCLPVPSVSEGEVYWLENDQELSLDLFKQLVKTTDFAVVTLPQFRQEVQKYFDTPLLFYSPEQFKGLQYRDVFTFRLFEQDNYKKASEKLTSLSSSITSSNVHRPKADCAQLEFGSYISQILISFTRATHRLFIFQPPNHKLDPLISSLRSFAQSLQSHPPLLIEKTNTASTANWLVEKERLLAMGKEEQAHNISQRLEAEKKIITHNSPTPLKKVKKKKKKKLNPTVQSTKQNLPSEVSKPIAATVTPNYSANSSHSPLVSLPSVPQLLVIQPKQAKLKVRAKAPSIPKELTPAQLRKNKMKRYKMLLELWASHFEESKLKVLFSHHDFYEIFLETPCGDRPNLFLYMIENECKVLTQFCVKYPAFGKKITAAMLNHCYADKRKFSLSVFYFLAKDALRKKLLAHLFTTYPDLTKEISSSTLYDVLPQEAGEAANTSAFYLLSMDKEGQEILLQIFEHNPNLFHGVSAQALFLTLPAEIEKLAHTSTFYWLAGTFLGQCLLKEFFIRNTLLLNEISATLLTQILPVKTEKNENLSILYQLSISKIGREIIALLLIHNVKLIQEIPVSALIHQIPKDTKLKIDNSSVLLGLSIDEIGIGIINAFLEGNPNLAQTLTAEFLCQPLIIDRDSTIYVVNIFDYLISNPCGHSSLNKLLNENKKIAQQISLDQLLLHTGKITRFYRLAMLESGCEIIRLLLENNPRNALQITPEILTELPVEPPTNLLYWFSSSSQGREILKILFTQNPALAAGLRLVDWEYTPPNVPEELSFSPLLCIATQIQEFAEFLPPEILEAGFKLQEALTEPRVLEPSLINYSSHTFFTNSTENVKEVNTITNGRISPSQSF